MALDATLAILHRYLKRLIDENLPVRGLVLYGSHARGEARDDSDIDVMALLEDSVTPAQIRDIWTRLEHLTIGVDTRIETWPVTVKRFETDEVSPLVIAARREGVRIQAAAA